MRSSSHTHSGPALANNLDVLYDYGAAERRGVEAYTAGVVISILEAIGRSLADLAPARLSVGHGSVAFAVNRREPTAEGIRIGVNPKGVFDHDVPVLKVAAVGGPLRAVVFGYACHNTTLGADVYRFSGDYAGYAQAALEQESPGSIAMFLMLCGGDQNPHP